MISTTNIPCNLLIEDDNKVPICLHINSWQFWNNKSSFSNGTNILGDKCNSEFICDRSSGPSDYHAEWRRYENGKYVLLLSCYGGENALEKIKEVDTFNEVVIYCATNLHPL